MLVEAVITWEDGTTEVIHASDFLAIFKEIGEKRIKHIDAYEINLRDMRQGRVNSCA